MKILVLHGPNLNMLGSREADHYGILSLGDINSILTIQADNAGHTLIIRQSNAEHELINYIHEATNINYIIINPGALAHTSIALRDALSCIKIPFIEVHMSNIYSREPFRHKSYLSDIAQGVICGFGYRSYELALQSLIEK